MSQQQVSSHPSLTALSIHSGGSRSSSIDTAFDSLLQSDDHHPEEQHHLQTQQQQNNMTNAIIPQSKKGGVLSIVPQQKQQQLVPMNQFSYKCCKCGCTSYTTGQSLTSGGFLSKILNIQTRKFVTITCNDCGFSEFYERYQNPLANVVDILIR